MKFTIEFTKFENQTCNLVCNHCDVCVPLYWNELLCYSLCEVCMAEIREEYDKLELDNEDI